MIRLARGWARREAGCSSTPPNGGLHEIRDLAFGGGRRGESTGVRGHAVDAEIVYDVAPVGASMAVAAT